MVLEKRYSSTLIIVFPEITLKQYLFQIFFTYITFLKNENFIDFYNKVLHSNVTLLSVAAITTAPDYIFKNKI